MRVIISGTRRGLSPNGLWAMTKRLRALPEDAIIVHGACRGVDQQAHVIAKTLGLGLEKHPARWDKHGNSAGAIRNQEMIDAGADLVLAYPDDRSRGTIDLIKRARAAQIPLEVYSQ